MPLKSSQRQPQPKQEPRSAPDNIRNESKDVMADASNALRRSTANLRSLTPSDILALQQTVGNKAVQRILSSQSPRPGLATIQRSDTHAFTQQRVTPASSNPTVIQRIGEGLLELPGSTIVKDKSQRDVPKYKIDIGIPGRVKVGADCFSITDPNKKWTIPNRTRKGSKLRNCSIFSLYRYVSVIGDYQAHPDYYYVKLNSKSSTALTTEGFVQKRDITTLTSVKKAKVKNSSQFELKDVNLSNYHAHKRQYGTIFNQDTPKMEDITQGGLGDCYLLASMISILQGPDGANRIKKLFPKYAEEEKADYVTVKFYNPKIQMWEQVVVRKSLAMVYYDSPKNLYAKSQLAIWPGLLEKAYVIWKGLSKTSRKALPTYKDISGGFSYLSTEQLTGIKGETEYNMGTLLKPAQLGPGTIKARGKGVHSPFSKIRSERKQAVQIILKDANDQSDWLTYTKNTPPTTNLATNDAIIAYIKASAIKDEAQTKLINYCTGKAGDDGRYLGSSKYSDSQVKQFTKIRSTLKQGGYVGGGTRKWAEGTGHSGGEDTTTVEGLAGGHAYSIISAKVVDGRYMVTLRNPWGDSTEDNNPHGVTYDDKNKITGHKSGTSEVDILDLSKYFDSIYYNK